MRERLHNVTRDESALAASVKRVGCRLAFLADSKGVQIANKERKMGKRVTNKE